MALLALVILACANTDKDPYGKWQLSLLNGQPVITQTQLTLELDDTNYSGFDGCNTFRGSYVYGTLEAGADGSFFLLPGFWTDAGCPTPDVKEQADSYRKAMTAGTRYRVVDGQLVVLD